MTDKEKVELLEDAVYEAICIYEDPYLDDSRRMNNMYCALLNAINKTKAPEYDDWGHWK